MTEDAVSASRIDSIRYTYGPTRKKPKAGDERYLEGRGVWQIRQQCRAGSAYLVSNGRPVWEWVDKGSERDRSVKRGERNENRRATGSTGQPEPSAGSAPGTNTSR